MSQGAQVITQIPGDAPERLHEIRSSLEASFQTSLTTWAFNIDMAIDGALSRLPQEGCRDLVHILRRFRESVGIQETHHADYGKGSTSAAASRASDTNGSLCTVDVPRLTFQLCDALCTVLSCRPQYSHLRLGMNRKNTDPPSLHEVGIAIVSWMIASQEQEGAFRLIECLVGGDRLRNQEFQRIMDASKLHFPLRKSLASFQQRSRNSTLLTIETEIAQGIGAVVDLNLGAILGENPGVRPLVRIDKKAQAETSAAGLSDSITSFEEFSARGDRRRQEKEAGQQKLAIALAKRHVRKYQRRIEKALKSMDPETAEKQGLRVLLRPEDFCRRDRLVGQMAAKLVAEKLAAIYQDQGGWGANFAFVVPQYCKFGGEIYSWQGSCRYMTGVFETNPEPREKTNYILLGIGTAGATKDWQNKLWGMNFYCHNGAVTDIWEIRNHDRHQYRDSFTWAKIECQPASLRELR